MEYEHVKVVDRDLKCPRQKLYRTFDYLKPKVLSGLFSPVDNTFISRVDTLRACYNYIEILETLLERSQIEIIPNKVKFLRSSPLLTKFLSKSEIETFIENHCRTFTPNHLRLQKKQENWFHFQNVPRYSYPEKVVVAPGKKRKYIRKVKKAEKEEKSGNKNLLCNEQMYENITDVSEQSEQSEQSDSSVENINLQQIQKNEQPIEQQIVVFFSCVKSKRSNNEHVVNFALFIYLFIECFKSNNPCATKQLHKSR